MILLRGNAAFVVYGARASCLPSWRHTCQNTNEIAPLYTNTVFSYSTIHSNVFRCIENLVLRFSDQTGNPSLCVRRDRLRHCRQAP